ncbi:response regulator [Dyadobacter sp. 32]|uniref:response regulator n=1 Tax=Dyadobacter sp. 32 TaxID=538966 RepID=UPI0011EE6F5B
MKTKILLVDDEVDMEGLFKMRFRKKIQSGHYEFVFVPDGLSALAMLEQQPDIDLVLSDINMPGMDGLSLLERLPEINPVIRTIMITAYGDMNNIRTAMNRGAFDFVTKPINFTDLEVTIDKTITFVSQLRETAVLKAVDEMKTRFFANITHEMRAPLSLIVSPVDKLLENLTLPGFLLNQLSVVRRNAWQLLRLINQLLDINKLEARQMDLVNEVGDLPGFVAQLVDIFRPSADIKQLALDYQTDLEPGNYLFDAGKWEKIMYNLLSNAIKFTESGSVSVNLMQTAEGARLIVSDTGIGIAADELPHIFDRFYQAGNFRKNGYEGTGIGLALVQELVRRMGGEARCESPASSTMGGTRFLLDIPVQKINNQIAGLTVAEPRLKVDPVPLAISDSQAVVLNDSSPLVLVVEDNAELREFIVAELASTYRIRSAANGHEGWIAAKEELPDVIISDLTMPRMDGFELIEKLKSDPETDHIPVILLTGNIGHASRLRGLASGAVDYLTKPFHLGELHLRIRNQLTSQQNLRRHLREQLARPDAVGSAETVQSQFLGKLYRLVGQRLDDSALSVEWLADEMGMSRKSLYRKVQSVIQLSPSDLITQYRLRKAIEFLRAGHNASETAYMTGFESPSYFAKVFRDFYQKTPSEFVKGM